MRNVGHLQTKILAASGVRHTKTVEDAQVTLSALGSAFVNVCMKFGVTKEEALAAIESGWGTGVKAE